MRAEGVQNGTDTEKNSSFYSLQLAGVAKEIFSGSETRMWRL
jgi:hypothetical protein